MDGMRRDKLMKRILELEANTKQLDELLNQDEKAALADTLQKSSISKMTSRRHLMLPSGQQKQRYHLCWRS